MKIVTIIAIYLDNEENEVTEESLQDDYLWVGPMTSQTIEGKLNNLSYGDKIEKVFPNGKVICLKDYGNPQNIVQTFRKNHPKEPLLLFALLYPNHPTSDFDFEEDLLNKIPKTSEEAEAKSTWFYYRYLLTNC